MFDDTDWSYFFFKLVLSGLKVTQSLFITYCVANTIAPARTRHAVTNVAWFGIEMYTIASMSVDSFIKKKADTFTKFLPKTTSSKPTFYEDDSMITCEYTVTDTLAFGDRELDVELLVLRMGKQLHVSSDFVLNNDLKQNPPPGYARSELFKKVDYKFISCAVFQNGTKLFDVDLSEGNGLGSFYSERNVLLDRLFLKFYVRRFLPKEANDLVKKLELDYEVQLIDGNADFHTLKPDHFVVIRQQGITCLVHNPPPPELTVESEETNEHNEHAFNNKEKTI